MAAAVKVGDLTGDVARPCHQKKERIDSFLDGPPTLRWDRLDDRFLLLTLCFGRGQDRPERQPIYPEVRRIRLSQALGGGSQAGFGNRICKMVGSRPEGTPIQQIDNIAIPAREVLRERLGKEERSSKIDIDIPLPHLKRRVLRIHRLKDGSAVDQNVKVAERTDGFRYEALAGSCFREVRLEGKRPPANVLYFGDGFLGGFLGGVVMNCDVAARFSQAKGECFTQALASAGHQCFAARQSPFEIHGPIVLRKPPGRKMKVYLTW